MATTFVKPTPRADTSAALEYVHGAEGERVAAIKSDLGVTQAEALAQVDGYLDGTVRKRSGLCGVHSFADDELDPADPASPQRAVEITYDLLKRQYGEGSLGHVVAHTDSKSGLIHTHFFVPNHDLTSGKALRANWRIESLRKRNDQLMRELGGPFKVPTPAERSMTPAEFYTDPATLAQAADQPVSALNYVTGREWARTRMHELTQNPAVESVDDLVQLAPDHGLSVQIRPATAKAGPTLTLAVVGADGEPVTCADTGSKLAWAGKKLGKAFTYEGVSAEVQARLDRQVKHTQEVASAQVTPTIEPVPAVTKERPAPSPVASTAAPTTPKPQVRQPEPKPEPKPQPVVTEPVAPTPKPQPAQPEPVAATAKPQVRAHPTVSKTPTGQYPVAWSSFQKSQGLSWDQFKAWHERQPEQVQVLELEGLSPAVAALPAETRPLMAKNPQLAEAYTEFFEKWSQRERRNDRDPNRTVDAVLSASRSLLDPADRQAGIAAQRAKQGPVRGDWQR